MAVTFESYERRIEQIKPVMEKYGIKDFEEALKICTDKGFNPYEIVKGVQPICFENAAWAYTLGAAIAIKKGAQKLQMLLEQLEKDYKLFVYLVLLQMLEKLDLDMEI